MKNKVCAVIVTYNPDKSFENNLKTILEQVDKVVVVDNQSTPTKKAFIQKMSELHGFTLILNKYNMGIAYALNQGLEFAINNNYEWLLTMDQDSLPEVNMVEKMLSGYNKIMNKQEIGLLAPAYFDCNSGYMSKNLMDSQNDFFESDLFITSGSLIKLSIISTVGQFDEGLFIDYVDHDFCLKLQKYSFKSICIPQAKLSHNMGDVKTHNFLFFQFFSHNYSPLRRYYMARNRLICYRRYFKKPNWIIRDFIYMLKELTKVILVEDNKASKVKAMVVGTIDGIINRMGPVTGYTPDMPKQDKYFVEIRKEIIPLLKTHSQTMLDLGCGTGATSNYLKSIGRANWVCGVEGNPKSATVAREKLDQVIETNIDQIEFPWKHEKFDTILALDILEHLMNPWDTMQKLTEILKEDGVLIASIPNSKHHSFTIPFLFLNDIRYQSDGILDSTHIRLFTKKSAINLLTSTGLKFELVKHTGRDVGSKSWIINLLTLNLFSTLFDFQYLIKVRKVKISD